MSGSGDEGFPPLKKKKGMQDVGYKVKDSAIRDMLSKVRSEVTAV